VLKRPGQPLDGHTAALMGDRFGADFSDVRVHTGLAAEQSAALLQARAYAQGSHIVLGAGQPRFDSREGRALLAHELAHVVQARSASGGDSQVSQPGSASEREAEGIAADLAAGRRLRTIRERAGGIHRNYVGSSSEVSTNVSETISNAPAGLTQWNGTFSWTSRFGLFYNAVNRTVTVIMRLHTTASDDVKRAWKYAIENKWSDRYALYIRGPKPGDREECYPLGVDVQWVDDAAKAHYTITPNAPGATAGGRAGLGGTISMLGWGTRDTVDVTHEFGHMLGNTEEYFTTNGVDFTFGGKKSGYRDPGGGVMNNPSENPEPRHYELVRRNAAALRGVDETRCRIGPLCLGPGDFQAPKGDMQYA